jgi:hypothetical protein
MVTIGLEFKDVTLQFPDDAARRQFLVQTVVPVILEKLTQGGAVPRAADPALDSRGVSVSVGITF